MLVGLQHSVPDVDWLSHLPRFAAGSPHSWLGQCGLLYPLSPKPWVDQSCHWPCSFSLGLPSLGLYCFLGSCCLPSLGPEMHTYLRLWFFSATQPDPNCNTVGYRNMSFLDLPVDPLELSSYDHLFLRLVKFLLESLECRLPEARAYLSLPAPPATVTRT